jgi:cytochrome c oxidase subunit III
MSLFAALTEKPWLSPGLSAEARARPDERPGPWDKGIGLGLFLFVVTMLFLLVTSAYLMRMGGHDGGHGASHWRAIGEPPLLWVNTAMLFASSFAFHASLSTTRAGHTRASRSLLLAGGLLGIAFLAGQIALWRILDDCTQALALGDVACAALAAVPGPPRPVWAANPATAFFYLISGLHGLHIIGGLVAWALTGRRMIAGGDGVLRAVQLCVRYWDYMLLVWLVMMGLFVLT